MIENLDLVLQFADGVVHAGDDAGNRFGLLDAHPSFDLGTVMRQDRAISFAV